MKLSADAKNGILAMLAGIGATIFWLIFIPMLLRAPSYPPPKLPRPTAEIIEYKEHSCVNTFIISCDQDPRQIAGETNCRYTEPTP